MTNSVGESKHLLRIEPNPAAHRPLTDAFAIPRTTIVIVTLARP
jgi:hypothetical protein